MNDNDWPSILSSQNLFVQQVQCPTCSIWNNASNIIVDYARILFFEFSPNIMNVINIQEHFSLNGLRYSLSGCIRSSGNHFTVVVKKNENTWEYIDDLMNDKIIFNPFNHVRSCYQLGWFFACYIQVNSNHLENLANESTMSVGSTFDEVCKTAVSKGLRKEVQKRSLSDSNIDDSLSKKFCSPIKVKRFVNTNDNKKNESMFEKKDAVYRKLLGNHKETEIQLTNHLLKIPAALNRENIPPLKSKSNLSSCEIALIKKFYDKMNKMEMNQCSVCHEVWCNVRKNFCVRCKSDEFSHENLMIPSEVPLELENLTQTEELLIARILPVMNVYCKPGGGQKGYR